MSASRAASGEPWPARARRALAACARLAPLLETEPSLEALSFYPHLLAFELHRLPDDTKITPVILLDTFEDIAEEVVGDVEGRSCVLVDDMIDTAGTITSAAQLLRDRGASEVRIATTHGVMSDPAAERLAAAPVEEVVVTNTLPIPDAKRFDTLTVLSIAPILAEALDAVFEDTSVSEIFRGDNV